MATTAEVLRRCSLPHAWWLAARLIARADPILSGYLDGRSAASWREDRKTVGEGRYAPCRHNAGEPAVSPVNIEEAGTPTVIQSSSMNGTIPPVAVRGGERALGSEGPATDLGN